MTDTTTPDAATATGTTSDPGTTGGDLPGFGDILQETTVAPSTLATFPGLQYLGCGYDIFGQYGSPESVMGPLFDLSGEDYIVAKFIDLVPDGKAITGAFTSVDPNTLNISYRAPAKVCYKPRFEADVDYQTDGTIKSEQTTLSAALDISVDVGLFSGEMNLRYDQTNTQLSSIKHYSATACMRYYDLTLEGYPLVTHPDLLPLDARFADDLESLDPAKLFEAYGSHYVAKITLGCRLTWGHTVDTSKVSKDYSIAAELKARYGGVGGSASAKATYTSSVENEFETIKFHSVGLDAVDREGSAQSEGGTGGLTGSDQPLDVVRGGWHNPVLIDIPDKGLRGIWTLCKNTTRADHLEKYFNETWLKSKGSPLVTPNIAPLYLLRTTAADGPPRYRLSPTLHPDDPAVAWGVPGNQTNQPSDTKPSFYVYATQHAGTVPLYEYYFHSPSSGIYRYETSEWSNYMQRYGDDWHRASSDPIGWVYDTGAHHPDPAEQRDSSRPNEQEGPVKSIPVYTLTTSQSIGVRYYWTTKSIDSTDNGTWVMPVLPIRDQSPYGPPPSPPTSIFGRPVGEGIQMTDELRDVLTRYQPSNLRFATLPDPTPNT